MCGAKLMENKRTEDLMEMLGLKETVVQMAKMVWTCVREGWWACFEKSVGVWSEGQQEARTTKNVEEASGEGQQELEEDAWIERDGESELEIAVRVG